MYLFPVLILRAGFAFWILQFLFIAFLLFLFSHVKNRFPREAAQVKLMKISQTD